MLKKPIHRIDFHSNTLQTSIPTNNRLQSHPHRIADFYKSPTSGNIPPLATTALMHLYRPIADCRKQLLPIATSSISLDISPTSVDTTAAIAEFGHLIPIIDSRPFAKVTATNDNHLYFCETRRQSIFVFYILRQQVYKLRTKLKGAGLKMVFTNEELIKQRAELFSRTRRRLKENKVVDCVWTFDGVIYVKNKIQNVHRIETPDAFESCKIISGLEGPSVPVFSSCTCTLSATFSLEDIIVSEQDVKGAISCMDPSKIGDPDLINPRYISEGACVLAAQLFTFVSKLIDSSTFPSP
ncbi:hypothetical protein MAR_007710 [Mya arenaria]|uniref:Ribosomal protein S2 n=1 Tax=Mya arenaria TaxID=6604 RepID=A0ABY7DX14_MYAAR|nr:hypothetical protein MAR_007710 [Mya arenaria]